MDKYSIYESLGDGQEWAYDVLMSWSSVQLSDECFEDKYNRNERRKPCSEEADDWDRGNEFQFSHPPDITIRVVLGSECFHLSGRVSHFKADI